MARFHRILPNISHIKEDLRELDLGTTSFKGVGTHIQTRTGNDVGRLLYDFGLHGHKCI